MIKKTFGQKGITYASELALKNIRDLSEVIDWNIDHQLLLYRMSSDMFPWMSEYQLKDLPDIKAIKKLLIQIGEKAQVHNMRLTFHPGHFNVLASNHPNVLEKSVKEICQHGEVMDLLGMPRSPFSKINIHVGGAYGDKSSALDRFIKNVEMLPQNARTRITIENDDKPNLFSVKELMYVHQATGIPIVFDYLHHQFCTGGLHEKEAMILAYSTWPKDIIPIVHYSSSRKKFEDPLATETSHADFVYDEVNTYGKEVDIMLEAKAKERAALQYISEFHVNIVGI